MIGALLEASGYERYVISHWGGKQNKVFQKKKPNRAKNSVVFFFMIELFFMHQQKSCLFMALRLVMENIQVA